MKTVTIYTDGACSGNPGPGGWGAILQYGESRKELSGGEAHTTNNRMELTGVITALEALKEPCEVELYSDSKYVIDALQKGWAKGDVYKRQAFVKAEVSARGRDFTLEARLGRGVRRQLYSNGVRLKSAGELSGVLNTVLFCPEDLYLIREGAATRRRFLDGCICQLRPKYAEALAEYRRLYEHKVRILRDWEEHPSLLDTLDCLLYTSRCV